MALMPGDGRYPISTFADLQAHYYRLMKGGDMDEKQYRIALAQLQEAQRRAAEHGSYFILEWGGVTYHPPTVTTNNLNLPAVLPPKPPAPRAPAGVHFASHQRVGDETRDGYIEHVHDMFARGFIDAGEHDARLKALMRTRTKEEMEFLIQDLPKVPDRTGGQVEPQKRGVLLYPVLAVTSGMGALGLLAEAPAHLVVFSLMIFIVLVAVSATSTVLGLASFVRRGK